ncbi:MAG: hypothetical protein WBQ23_16045 [Bacteroidota bacterium]
MTTRISIPFKLASLYQGLAEAHGRAHVDEHGLRIEYRIEDAVFGFVKTRVRELHIPFEEIDDVEFRDHWWGRRLIFHLHSLHSVADFPDSKEGRIVLKIKRDLRQRAREFHSFLSLQVSEEKLRRLTASDDWED